MIKGIFHLKGVVKHYDWGGFTFIPTLLDVNNDGKKPFAEYWLGVHPLGSSLFYSGEVEKKLEEVLPTLPFLLKVLDVKDMLSIQVHPSLDGAIEGYERENREAIAMDSPYRNYKDKNHKPELMVALGEFWLLHGFKPEKELAFTLLNVVELRELLPVFNEQGYSGLYKHVMEMPQEEVNRILEPLVKNISELTTDQLRDKEDEDYWVARAIKLFCREGFIDRGIFSIYLLNLVHLQKGQGIFQAAGLPHAYLEGQNVEIMANSDNVLRGGLTNKNLAVYQLLKHTKLEPTIPELLTSKEKENHEKVYDVPVVDFKLSSIELKSQETFTYYTPGIEFLLLIDGNIIVECNGSSLTLEKGKPAAVVFDDGPVFIRSNADSFLFRATTAIKPLLS